MASVDNPTLASAMVPEREVTRRSQAPEPPAEDTNKRKRQVMVATLLDVLLSRRHETRLNGVHKFPALVLVVLNEVRYTVPKPGNTIQTPHDTRVEWRRRYPYVIAERLTEKYGDPEMGVTALHWLTSLAGIEDAEYGPVWEQCRCTEADLYQALLFPVVPNEYGAIRARLGHIERMRGLNLAGMADRSRALVRERLGADSQKTAILSRRIDGAVAAFRGTDHEDRIAAAVEQLYEGIVTGIERAEMQMAVLISEMDSASRSKPGKDKPDEGDRKLFHLMGQPLPQISMNVRQSGGSRQETLLERLGYGSDDATLEDMKECLFCAERIKAKAVRCRFCGSNLDDAPPTSPEPEAAKNKGGRPRKPEPQAPAANALDALANSASESEDDELRQVREHMESNMKIEPEA
jgi:hypothetical protein